MPNGAGREDLQTVPPATIKIAAAASLSDRLIIDNWTDHAPTEDSATMDLGAGRKYNLRLEYFETEGGAQVRLAWSSPSQPRQIIPQSRLFSLADPTFPLPTPLLRLEPVADGQMRLVIDADTKSNYSVEATDDFRQWMELIQFISQAGLLEFIDRDATNYHRRFYRATGR